MSFEVLQGDCIARMAEMGEASVDAVVCDPPYGLSREPDIAEVLEHWLAGDNYHHRGGGFMGQSWDSFVPGPAYWREALRVLKPGGHLLAFAGSRTSDLMGISIRFAGFEIRDSIMWLYASGFPKSLDVSKAIDKRAAAEREVVGVRPDAAKLNREPQEAPAGWRTAERCPNITAPATPEAAEWDGWGTALKPAHEPIVVARKPLIGTVAANVLEHGTGGINVDACRVSFSDDEPYDIDTKCRPNSRGPSEAAVGPSGGDVNVSAAGRWPSNVVLDEGAAAELDAQTGELHSQDPATRKSRSKVQGVTEMGTGQSVEYADRGGASRFFYCAKTSRGEREAGLSGEATLDGGVWGGVEDDLSDGKKRVTPRVNGHPTVKPINLMRWLVSLVTPPGGTVLDPFTGSGSTGCAAVLEGFDFIGIEREADYIAIAKARINFWAQHEGRETKEALKLDAALAKAAKRDAERGQGQLQAA